MAEAGFTVLCLLSITVCGKNLAVQLRWRSIIHTPKLLGPGLYYSEQGSRRELSPILFGKDDFRSTVSAFQTLQYTFLI